MRRLIMWNVVTLDGRFEGEKPWDLDFHERVWGPELEKLSLEQMASAAALIFGRRTYEGMASYWSKETGQIADGMNAIRKVVFSRTLESADWNNSAVERDPAAAIRALKQEGGGDLYVFGSADLSKTLIQEHLIDEYRIAVAPVIQGVGRHLFTDGAAPAGLKLLEARPLSNGGVILRYAPEG